MCFCDKEKNDKDLELSIHFLRVHWFLRTFPHFCIYLWCLRVRLIGAASDGHVGRWIFRIDIAAREPFIIDVIAAGASDRIAVIIDCIGNQTIVWWRTSNGRIERIGCLGVGRRRVHANVCEFRRISAGHLSTFHFVRFIDNRINRRAIHFVRCGLRRLIAILVRGLHHIIVVRILEYFIVTVLFAMSLCCRRGCRPITDRNEHSTISRQCQIFVHRSHRGVARQCGHGKTAHRLIALAFVTILRNIRSLQQIFAGSRFSSKMRKTFDVRICDLRWRRRIRSIVVYCKDAFAKEGIVRGRFVVCSKCVHNAGHRSIGFAIEIVSAINGPIPSDIIVFRLLHVAVFAAWRCIALMQTRLQSVIAQLTVRLTENALRAFRVSPIIRWRVLHCDKGCRCWATLRVGIFGADGARDTRYRRFRIAPVYRLLVNRRNETNALTIQTMPRYRIVEQSARLAQPTPLQTWRARRTAQTITFIFIDLAAQRFRIVDGPLFQTATQQRLVRSLRYRSENANANLILSHPQLPQDAIRWNEKNIWILYKNERKNDRTRRTYMTGRLLRHNRTDTPNEMGGQTIVHRPHHSKWKSNQLIASNI